MAIQWIIVGGCILFFVITVASILLSGSGRQRRETQIRDRVADGCSEISDLIEDARDEMRRRAGFDDPFRLGRTRGGRW
jgi:hypothetical protein